MWITLASAALLGPMFLGLTLQAWRYSREVGSELGVHNRARLSRRLQGLTLASAGVAVLALGIQGAFVARAAPAPASPVATQLKSLTLRLDPALRSMPRPAPRETDVALADSAR